MNCTSRKHACCDIIRKRDFVNEFPNVNLSINAKFTFYGRLVLSIQFLNGLKNFIRKLCSSRTIQIWEMQFPSVVNVGRDCLISLFGVGLRCALPKQTLAESCSNNRSNPLQIVAELPNVLYLLRTSFLSASVSIVRR